MGDIADMMLDGTLCEGCGGYMDEDGSGIPRYCSDQCAGAGVAFHFKQWGEWAPVSAQMEEDSPANLRLRYGDRAFVFGDHQQMGKVGKKHAGRLLDGVEHSAFPTVLSLSKDGRAHDEFPAGVA